MRTLLVMTVLATLLLTAAYAQETDPLPVTIRGELSCISCGAVFPGITDVRTETGFCTVALAATDGRVYAFVPNAVGRDLSMVTMHGQQVEISGYVLPNSQLIEPRTYRFVEITREDTFYEGLMPFEGRPGVPPVYGF